MFSEELISLEQPSEPFEIHFSDKIPIFLKESKIPNPKFVISLEYYQVQTGGGCFCSGEMQVDSLPRCKIELVEHFVPGKGFIMVSTKEGIPVYMAKPIYDIAVKLKSNIRVDTKGPLRKTLTLEGIDLSSLPGGGKKSSFAR